MGGLETTLRAFLVAVDRATELDAPAGLEWVDGRAVVNGERFYASTVQRARALELVECVPVLVDGEDRIDCHQLRLTMRALDVLAGRR